MAESIPPIPDEAKSSPSSKTSAADPAKLKARMLQSTSDPMFDSFKKTETKKPDAWSIGLLLTAASIVLLLINVWAYSLILSLLSFGFALAALFFLRKEMLNFKGICLICGAVFSLLYSLVLGVEILEYKWNTWYYYSGRAYEFFDESQDFGHDSYADGAFDPFENSDFWDLWDGSDF